METTKIIENPLLNTSENELFEFTVVSGDTRSLESVQDLKKFKPKIDPVTRSFPLYPVKGLMFMENSKIQATPALVEYMKEQQKSTDFAFSLVKFGKESRLCCNLSSAEQQFSVAILAEFVAQSQPYLSSTIEANKDINKENRKLKKVRKEESKKGRKEEGETIAQNQVRAMAYQTSLDFELLPLQTAHIGQRAEDVPASVQALMKKQHGIVFSDLWLDDQNKVYEECRKDKKIYAFKYRSKLYYVTAREQANVETYQCERYDEEGEEGAVLECVRIHRRKADKFIFITRAGFCKKYLNAGAKSYAYQNFFSLLYSLANKRIPVIDEEGNATTSQFFTVDTNFCSSDGRDFIMLKLESSEILEGLESNFLKLQEHPENIIGAGGKPLLSLWGFCLSVARRDRKKRTIYKGVSVQEMTIQELFESTARIEQIENGKLKAHLPKLKEALEALKSENMILSYSVNGSGKDDICQASKNDIIRINVNLNYAEKK